MWVKTRSWRWVTIGAVVWGGETRAAEDWVALFVDPPAAYDTVPFWVWNDHLTSSDVVRGLDDLAAKGMRASIIHPRPGLTVPYLEEPWFKLWSNAIHHARTIGAELWIYDENSYPSGFAGGWVPEAMPEARAVNLVAEESARAPKASDDLVAVFRLHQDHAEEITGGIRTGAELPEGRYLAIRRRYGRQSDWFAGWWYVDLLRPGVTEKFLELTLEPYRQRWGDEFGRLIRGVFTDEPHLSGAGGLPWTDDFADQFRRRRGYELVPHLVSLFAPIGE